MPAHIPANLQQQIQSTLTGLATGPLAANARSFFSTLGYKSDRSLPVNSLAELRTVLDTGNYLTEENALLSRWRSVHLLFQLTQNEIDFASDGQLTLGFTAPYETKDIRSYVFFALDLEPSQGNEPPTRTEMSTITRALNRLVPMPVLVLFRHGEAISLAIINRRKNLRDGTRDVLTRVSLIRNINARQPHRAHLDLLERFSLHRLRDENASLRTFNDLDSAWQKLLSVQELNKRFYRDLVDWFTWAIKEIKLARLPDHVIDDPQGKNRAHATQEFTVRLICRLLFAWFLKEMRLIPADLLELYNAADSRRILTRGADEAAYLEGNHYYRGILQNIFFMALNKPMGERRKNAQQARNDREVTDPELQKFVFVGKQNLPENFDYDLFDRIPYLNGGLFDALPEDNLEFTHEEGNLFTVPNKLFYARREDNYTITVGTARRPIQKPVEGINRLFDRYRFTVMENTPLEEDVALDPELLGLVFENLLAEIDPTDEAAAESARKASGSYYTPRRIVDYMVNEALYLHIKTRFEQAGASKDDLLLLGQLCYHAEGVDFTPIAARVVAELDAVHVLDPACGSGAFPMGMLHRMVELLRIVDSDNELWKQRLLARLPAEVRADAARGMEGKNYNYLRKLGLIQKNLYGLDIQPLATLIAKLRFFLTLVIEQEVNPADRVHNYNLQALPNLETNLLCCNTLVDIEHGLLSGSILEDLRSTREEYYQPQTSATRREELAQQIGRDLANLFPGFAEQTRGILPETPQMRHAQDALWIAEWFKHATVAAPFFNVETFFPELVDGGTAQHPAPFHIVIGNPPYGGDPIADTTKNYFSLGSKDPYGAFIARFLGDPQRPTPLADGGVLAFIVSDTFMTIKTHRPLREQMLQNRIHKILRVHPDTFHATVNCAVIICQRGQAIEDPICQMADLTNVSIHDQYEYFVHLLTKAEGFARRQNISNQTYAIYHYRQSLISSNSNLPFFVASPKLFAIMNDINAPIQNQAIASLRVPCRSVFVNGKKIDLVRLGDIADVKVGLQTGDNDAYLFQNPAARGTYQSIDDHNIYLLTEADLGRIRSDHQLRLDVVQNGISKDNQSSQRYFGGRYIVPYDKGGESDSDEGWMPNYYVPTNYFIDWSEWAVSRMKSLTLREKNRINGKPGGDDRLTSRFQNTEYYFQRGITFSDTGFYAPTFRINSGSVFDVMGMTIFGAMDPMSECALLTSKFIRFLIKNYINATVHTQVEGLKPVPLPIYNNSKQRLAELTNQIVLNQQNTPRYDYASNEQLEVDRLVYDAYGLNDADIRDVGDWYVRRYPKLAAAQRKNLAAKQGITEEQLTEWPRLHLFCDESCHLPHDRAPFLLLGLTSCPADKVRAAHEQLAAIWDRFNLPKHLEVKWTKVSPGRLDFYQAVLEWFFASENVVFRALALPDKQRLYAALPPESRDALYYRLYYQLLRTTIEQENRYRVFIDLKDTRGREKITHLIQILRDDANDPYGRSVESLQHVHSHEIKLLQVCDLLMGAVGFARRPVAENESPAKRKLVEFIENRLGYPLTSDSPPGEEKCSIITWHDPDALLL